MKSDWQQAQLLAMVASVTLRDSIVPWSVQIRERK